MVIVSVVCVFGLAASSEASLVTLDIQANAGAWQVYADVSLDSEGLASMALDVTADGGLAISGSTNEAPKGFDLGAMTNWGFDNLRSDGTLGIGIDVGQKTIYSGVNDPNKDALVLLDVGQMAGSRSNAPFAPDPITWAAHVLLASGTYSGTVGTLYVVGSGNTLDSVGSWEGPGNVSTATWEGDSVYIPEPATLAVLALGGLAMLMRKR